MHLFSLIALLAAPAFLASCNTSGLKKVYMAPDTQGLGERLQFAGGSPTFCIADVAIGDPKTTLKVSMQPVAINGEPTGLPRMLIAEHLPGKFSGKIATEFPKVSVQAVPDARDPNQFVTLQAAQAAGRYRCVVELDDEVDFIDFEVLAGEQPTVDPNAPSAGSCRAETVASCPLTNAGANIVRCCTQAGTCGTGPRGTGFCYASN